MGAAFPWLQWPKRLLILKMVCIPSERLRELWWKCIASHPITQGSEMPINAASYWSRALGINSLTFVCKPTRCVLPGLKQLCVVNSMHFLPYGQPNSVVNPAVASSLSCRVDICGLSFYVCVEPSARFQGKITELDKNISIVIFLCVWNSDPRGQLHFWFSGHQHETPDF